MVRPVGRPSKLSPRKWTEVKQRLYAGEGVRALAREFGISPSAISAQLSAKKRRVNALAGRLVNLENDLDTLPLSEQRSVISLAEKLKAISDSLASAAANGARTADHLSRLAAEKVVGLDGVDSEQAAEGLKVVSVLTRIGNDAAVIGLGLMAANRGVMSPGGGAAELAPAQADEIMRVSNALRH